MTFSRIIPCWQAVHTYISTTLPTPAAQGKYSTPKVARLLRQDSTLLLCCPLTLDSTSLLFSSGLFNLYVLDSVSALVKFIEAN